MFEHQLLRPAPAVSPAAPPYAAMPINAETVNLAATYMILVILLFFLWLLYSIVF